MFDNTRVDPWHLFIGPSKYISKFFKELHVDQDFFWRTICTDIYVFNLTKGTRDVDVDDRRNTRHVVGRELLITAIDYPRDALGLEYAKDD
jgi:hypothetical protein